MTGRRFPPPWSIGEDRGDHDAAAGKASDAQWSYKWKIAYDPLKNNLLIE
jgi:hypothetical protein